MRGPVLSPRQTRAETQNRRAYVASLDIPRLRLLHNESLSLAATDETFQPGRGEAG